MQQASEPISNLQAVNVAQRLAQLFLFTSAMPVWWFALLIGRRIHNYSSLNSSRRTWRVTFFTRLSYRPTYPLPLRA